MKKVTKGLFTTFYVETQYIEHSKHYFSASDGKLGKLESSEKVDSPNGDMASATLLGKWNQTRYLEHNSNNETANEGN